MTWYKPSIKDSEAKPTPHIYVPPTWSWGTDEEIVEALEKHYNDEIDLTEYWAVGDERKVTLSAMSSYSPLTDTHSSQEVTLVLMGVGGKTLNTSINGHTECVFIVGQKNCLATTGKFNNTATTTGWSSSNRRKWCNNTYYNAIPETLRPIFKQHKNYVANSYSATTPTTTTDYFCLPSVKEITGASYPDSTNGAKAEVNNLQLSYYLISSNRIKYQSTSTTKLSYWTSSKYYASISSSSDYTQSQDSISTSGMASRAIQTTAYG